MRKRVMAKEGDNGDNKDLLEALRQLGGQNEILEFLSEGFCTSCKGLLQNRLENIRNGKLDTTSSSNLNHSKSKDIFCSMEPLSSSESGEKHTSLRKNSSPSHESSAHSLVRTPVPNSSPSHENSAQSLVRTPVPISSARHHTVSQYSPVQSEVSVENEFTEMSRVIRKKDFVYMESIDGKPVNILKGLELHKRVFNEVEQKKIVDCVYKLQRLGHEGQLRARTYSEPRKWMPGKGRVTIQFGCCYNYAADKKGNPPGIIRDEEVDPLPPLFKFMIKRMVRWHVLPPTCIPNSCIVNIYDEGDCIPPHIDHHDFVRPFCTVSFLTECNILFGSTLKIVGAGVFSGPVAVPLPLGSVLILSGNGADIAKHCVPGVPSKRISITFRKMDDSKLPFGFRPDPELQGLQPLSSSLMKSPVQQVLPTNPVHQNKQASSNGSVLLTKPVHQNKQVSSNGSVLLTKPVHQNKQVSSNGSGESVSESAIGSFNLVNQDFPPLGGSNSSSRSKPNKNKS